MADYDYLTTSGVIVPDTSDTLAQVQQEFRDALGASLNVNQGPQQVLIAAEVAARQAVARNNAAVANQINPALAGGVFLDALWALTGGARLTATRSVVPAVALTGQPGTVIPAGSIAATVAGDQFASASSVTLSAGGTGACDFIAQAYGPVGANANALTVVVSAVLGWETVTNPTAATLGQNAETDSAARLRRRNTLALQGVGLPEAIISGLYATPGVRSVQFRENTAAAGATIDTIVMVANSVWACVDGGADADVAATLLAKKSMGASWNGAVTVNVSEPASGQLYAVKFDRPTPVPVLARVTVGASGVPGDPVALVQQAVLDFAAGLLPFEIGFTVGRSVSPFELAGAINSEVPGLYVQKVEVTKAAVVSYQTTEVALAVNEIAAIVGGSIIVNVL